MSEVKKRRQYEYDKKAYDHIHLQTPKGKKQEIQDRARLRGQSLNGYINDAIDEKMQRDQEERDGQ